MQLTALERRLRARLLRAERGFKDAQLLVDRHLRRHRLEGVLSDAWQGYCWFSREVCIASSLGATAASGVVTTASIAPVSWERASYIALRAAKGDVVHPGKTNSVLRKEPTWGDPLKVDLILHELKPSNEANLRSYFVGGLQGPKHCQIVRNAAAHKNPETLAEVKALAPHYLATPVILPTDSMMWRDPTTSTFAFESWLDDMRTIASGAVN